MFFKWFKDKDATYDGDMCSNPNDTPSYQGKIMYIFLN